MLWLTILIGILLTCFGGVLLFGAPYVPTLTPQVTAALDLAAMKPGQTLLELGCGDGKILIAAAERGCKAIGYELNPIMAAIAWIRTRRYRGRVIVKCANFWTIDLPRAEVIFVFLLPKYMFKLDTKIIKSGMKPLTLISFAFKVPGKKIVSEQAGVFKYRYE